MTQRRYSISEVAERVGFKPWTLRQLEKRGILPPAQRDYNDRRTYNERDIQVIQSILYPARERVS